MKKRPLVVTIVCVLFIVIGIAGLTRGVYTFLYSRGGITGHDVMDAGLVTITSLAALLGGLLMLRASNWARWLCLAWMAFHVVISLGHDRLQFIVHSLWLVVLTVALFWPSSSAYFKRVD